MTQPPHSPTKHPPPSTTSSSLHPPLNSSSSSRLFQFIHSELFPPSSSTPHPPDQVPDDEDTAAYYRRREKVYTFVKIPKELEKLMGYGFFQCADAFLYVFTFLPLRCAIAIYNYVWSFICNQPVYLKPSDKCELFKIVIMIICSLVFTFIDFNILYHLIKSQSVIKLYIFFNMLEVGDRLFSSFSQDSLDALFITATEQHVSSSSTASTPPSSPFNDAKSRTKSMKKLSTSAHAIICGLSILGHALVILLQSTTLSVAINANNRALLTVMMSNNFVELKGSVFKKFDKMNLFQVSCSDIRERFHLFVLLVIVCLQTLREYAWAESRFWVLLPDCLMVMVAEIGVDWIKHAFITRFNELPLQVYEHYTRSLAYDVAESLKRKSNRVGFGSDYSDIVGRRLGFVPLPLAIVLIRVVTPMWRVNDKVLGILVLSVLGYVGLATFRVLNMIVLVGKAVKIIDEHHSGGFGGEETQNVERRGSVGANCGVKNSILKRSRTISGSDGDLLKLVQNEKVDKKLTFEDDLQTEGEKAEGIGKIHLFANSNVSLNSIGFNEEMLKVEAKLEEEVISKIASERKHSLGSNLYEGVMLGGDYKTEVEDDNPFVGGDLNTTVIENEEKKDMGQEETPEEGVSIKAEKLEEEEVPVKEEAIEVAEEATSVKVENPEEDANPPVPHEDIGSGDGNPSGGGTDSSEVTTSTEEPSSRPSSSKKKLINWFKDLNSTTSS